LDVFGTTGKALDLLGVNTDNADARLAELNEELQSVEASTAQLNSQLVAISAQAKEAAANTQAQLSLERQLEQIERTGTTEDLEKLRETADIESDALRDTLRSKTIDLREALLEQARLVIPEIDEILQGIDDPADRQQALIDAILGEGQQLAPGIVELQGVVADLEGQIDKTATTIERSYSPALIAAVQANEAHTKALEDEKKAAEEAADAEKKRAEEIEKLRDDLIKTTESLQDLESDRAAKLAEQAIRDAQAATEAGLRAQIATAKEQEQADERRNKILATQKEAQDKEVDALQKHNAQKALEQAAFDLEQRRRVEDLNTDLDEAAADRDVKSFLRIQADGKKELDRAEEDNEIKQQTEADALNEQLQEIRRSANERIRVEQEAGRQRVTQSQRLEQQLATFQANSTQQNQTRARLIEEQGYQQRLNALRNHMQQITQELVTQAGRGLGAVLRVAAGGSALNVVSAVPGLPPTAQGAGGGVSVAITIQQQNVGRVATPQDVEVARNETRNLATAINNALRNTRTNTGRR
jgi:hypothetical protein